MAEKDRLRIDQLKYNFDQGARPNRYYVTFSCPKLGISDNTVPGGFGIRCINATLPGRQLEASDSSTYGPLIKHPFNVSNDGQEANFTFACDSGFADRFVIEAWQSMIYSQSANATSTRNVEQDGGPLGGGKYEEEQAFNVSLGSSAHPMFDYYDNYVGTIKIYTLTQSGAPSLVYTLHEAFPIAFAPQQLAYESSNQIMTFECTFAFRTWSSLYENPPNSTLLNRGSRFINALLGLKNLRKGGNKANDRRQKFADRLSKLSGIIGVESGKPDTTPDITPTGPMGPSA